MTDPIAYAAGSNNFISMATWLAPSPLFIFVNLVIGTIAIVTRFNAVPKKQIKQQLLFQRVKSFNLRHYNQNQPKSVTQNESDQCESTQSQLVQNPKPSLLQRVVSFKLNKQEPQRKTQYVQAESEHSWMKPLKPVKLKLDLDLGPNPVNDEDKNKVEMLKKSASEKECCMTFDWEDEEDEETVERRRPSTAMARSETTMCKEDEGVDSKADDFINMFKKQLRLQRLDSFIRYRNTLCEDIL